MLRQYRWDIAAKVYEGRYRSEWMNTNIYTDDERLLEHVLNSDTMPKLTRVEHISDQYVEEMDKIHGVATGVLIVRKREAHQTFKIFLKNNYSLPEQQKMVIDLKDFIQDHENFTVTAANIRRMGDGKIYDSNYCRFYCDSEDALTMICLIAGPALHKIYKVIEKENNQ